MPLPVNIADIITQRVVENARVDYKSDWNPEPIIHSICAFANDIDNWGGGYIILGIEDDNGMPRLPVKGIDKASIDRINKELLEKCNFIEPRYIPIVEHTQYEGKDILVLWVPGGPDRPYKCPVSLPGKKGGKIEKAYYIRKTSNTIRANTYDEKELFLLANSLPFDDRPNLSAGVEMLRASLISEFLSRVKSDLYPASQVRPVEEIATAMRLIGGPPELTRPLNCGLMFFNERPDAFFPYARIEVVDKPDPTGIGMTEKVFTGPLDKQLRDALSYIRNYILKERVTKVPNKAEAERFYNFPYGAVEEALTNAVYHKSYQIGEPVTVSVTPEKMEITSLPGPDRSISDADLANRHLISRRYRNRRIGDFLKELKFVEGRNTGIPTMLRSMEMNGSPPPVFETDADRTYFTVILPIHEVFLPSAQAQMQRVAGKKRRNGQQIRDAIQNALAREGSLPTSRIAELLGYAKVTDAVSRAIHTLIADGKARYLLPDTPRSPRQRICPM